MTIKYSDVDFDMLQVYCYDNSVFLRYNNDKPLYIQTCLYDDYSIPNHVYIHGMTFNKNISDRSYVKTKIIPDTDNYYFYYNLDWFLGGDLFKTKLIDSNLFKTNLIKNINYKYEPIIKNHSNVVKLKYYLPHQKIRIGYPEGIESDDHDTKLQAFFIKDDDEFFEYISFNYKLSKKFNGIRSPIHFNTFD